MCKSRMVLADVTGSGVFIGVRAARFVQLVQRLEVFVSKNCGHVQAQCTDVVLMWFIFMYE